MKDYRERKPVGKNRPKKKPLGLYVMVVLGTALPAFALGTLAGWFLFRTDPAVIQKQVTEQVAKELAKAAPPPGTPTGGAVPAGPVPEPSLTFYETLPKGGKAALGSGINPIITARPAAAPAPAATPDGKAAAAAKPAVNPPPASPATAAAVPESPISAAVATALSPAKETVAAPAQKKPAGKGTYTLQTASYQDKREAEELRNKLMAKGHQAYIVESPVPGKGTWYRIRIGRHLDDAAARELAGKLGKNTMIVPE